MTSDLHFPAFAGPDLIDDCPNHISAKANPGPRCRHQHQNRQLPVCQILLIAEALIRSDQELVSIVFGSIQEGAIPQLRPSTFEGRFHNVLRQMTPQRYRSSLIEQDLHEATVSANAWSSWSRTVSTFHRSTPGNHSRNWSIDAPALRFSKRAETGTRVSLNTHAPLTRSGSRSTAGQASQFAMSVTSSSRLALQCRSIIPSNVICGSSEAITTRRGESCPVVQTTGLPVTLDRARLTDRNTL